MTEKPLVEKFCTCGKVSWDSQFGLYGETHETGKYSGKYVKCNQDGGTYIDGIRQ